MKQTIDFTVRSCRRLTPGYTLLHLTPSDGSAVPDVEPGQFVQVAVEAPGVFLRRPISIHEASPETLSLLVRVAGRGTEALCALPEGARVNLLMPLGRGFTVADAQPGKRYLLIGGGVGVAPLLLLGQRLRGAGAEPVFLLGARSEADLLRLSEFQAVGEVHVTTEDGSAGVRGFVTAHPRLTDGDYERWYCCGPMPMMKAVAALARKQGADCEVSLENVMACGLGACLCCVEKTVKGNVCVCTEGPVFNIDSLTW